MTDCKLEELTREVRAHNDFARRVPVLEMQMQENSRSNLRQDRYPISCTCQDAASQE